MPFTDGAQAQNETAATLGRAGLIGMPDDARVEQGRRLERILVKKISTDQAALREIQCGMRRERVFHLCGARSENFEQIPVTALEIFQHVAQLLCRRFGIEPENPVDDMVRPGFIGRIEVPRLSRRLERPDDDSGWVRTQIEGLAVEESGLGQRGSLGLFEVRSC